MKVAACCRAWPLPEPWGGAVRQHVLAPAQDLLGAVQAAMFDFSRIAGSKVIGCSRAALSFPADGAVGHRFASAWRACGCCFDSLCFSLSARRQGHRRMCRHPGLLAVRGTSLPSRGGKAIASRHLLDKAAPLLSLGVGTPVGWMAKPSTNHPGAYEWVSGEDVRRRRQRQADAAGTDVDGTGDAGTAGQQRDLALLTGLAQLGEPRQALELLFAHAIGNAHVG